MRPVPSAPKSFEGSLDRLHLEHIEAALPSAESIIAIHRLICRYVDESDPLFLIRNRGKDERGVILHLPDRTRIRQTDNSPAWWIHHLAFQGSIPSSIEEFAEAVENAPFHFFQNARAKTAGISRADWYVAHLLRASPPGSTLPVTRAEAKALFVRNIHPLNHFYLPKTGARLYEGRPEVLAYFAHLVRARFAPIWEEFLDWAGADARKELASLPAPSSDISYRFGEPSPATSASQSVPQPGEAAVRYAKSRLWFQADIIEPLGWDQDFQIDTPEGRFRMTKRQFYETFANVVGTASYRENRHYHYKSIPAKAQRFRLSGS